MISFFLPVKCDAGHFSCFFSHVSESLMHKLVKVNIISAYSPTYQTLVNEHSKIQKLKSSNDIFENCVELLVIRFQGVVISFCTFNVIEGDRLQVSSMHFRNILKSREFTKYWLSRSLNKYLSNKFYLQFLLEK